MILYRNLTSDELCLELFRYFIRRQVVTKCWRRENDTWLIKDVPFIDDWTEADYQVLISCLKNTLSSGGFVYGAFDDKKLKGFVSVESALFADSKAPHIFRYMDAGQIQIPLFSAKQSRLHGHKPF